MAGMYPTSRDTAVKYYTSVTVIQSVLNIRITDLWTSGTPGLMCGAEG